MTEDMLTMDPFAFIKSLVRYFVSSNEDVKFVEMQFMISSSFDRSRSEFIDIPAAFTKTETGDFAEFVISLQMVFISAV